MPGKPMSGIQTRTALKTRRAKIVTSARARPERQLWLSPAAERPNTQRQETLTASLLKLSILATSLSSHAT